jgi:pesticin/yersiniabactin receptor
MTAAMLAAVAIAAAPAASAQRTGADGDRKDAETIVVIGKREQTVETLASAVSVISVEALRNREVARTDDLQRLLPGLTINARGNRAYSNITIRGISSPDFFNPAVQVYVDGIPQTPSAFTQPLLDVERVEFLRGPQGTIYGANALAGVINVVTRQPRESRAYAEGSLSTLGARAEAAGTWALAPGALFVDMGVFADRGFGRIDDQSTGRRDIDTSNTIFGRLAIRYAPENGVITARLFGSREKMRSREELYLIDDDASRLRYRSAIYGPLPFLQRDLSTLGGQVVWRIADDIRLSTLTSWQKSDLRRDFPGRVPDFLFRWPQRDELLSQEVRLARGGDHVLTGIVGLWYQKDGFTSWKNSFPGYFGDSVNHVDSASHAAFADITVRPFHALEVSLGGRFGHDRVSIDGSRQDSFANGMGFAFRGRSSYDSFQPKVAVGYAVADAVRLYGTVSRGYKPGGYNHSVSSLADATAYEPESAWNYEIGTKASRLGGGKLSLAIAAYRIRSTDKQIYVGILGQQIIRNAGSALSRGIEAEAAWRVTGRLDLAGNVTIGRSRFTDFVDRAAGKDYTGNAIPYAPNSVARLTAGYTIPSRLFGTVRLTAGVNATSRSFFDEANVASQEPVAIVDAGVEMGSADGMQVRLFVVNLADRIVRTSGYVFDRSYWTVDTGRRIGLTMRHAF